MGQVVIKLSNPKETSTYWWWYNGWLFLGHTLYGKETHTHRDPPPRKQAKRNKENKQKETNQRKQKETKQTKRNEKKQRKKREQKNNKRMKQKEGKKKETLIQFVWRMIYKFKFTQCKTFFWINQIRDMINSFPIQ